MMKQIRLVSCQQGERATGYGVALLNVLFGKYSEAALLQEACPLPENRDWSKPSESKKMRKK